MNDNTRFHKNYIKKLKRLKKKHENLHIAIAKELVTICDSIMIECRDNRYWHVTSEQDGVTFTTPYQLMKQKLTRNQFRFDDNFRINYHNSKTNTWEYKHLYDFMVNYIGMNKDDLILTIEKVMFSVL